MPRVKLPELGALATVRLWLSFQRYALLLTALAICPLLVVGLLAPTIWWAWLLALPISARVGSFAVFVWGRWPGKRHALRVALHRMAAGRFEPAQIRKHCADPCFRVVAHACLRRAGHPAAERRRIIAAYTAQLRDESSQMLVFDHVRGEIIELRRPAQDLHVPRSPIINPPSPSESIQTT